jgi:hypothetical protein
MNSNAKFQRETNLEIAAHRSVADQWVACTENLNRIDLCFGVFRGHELIAHSHRRQH